MQGSGTPGNPITVYWEPHATLSSPAGTASVLTNGQSYITLDGGTDGSIQATALGSALPDHGHWAQAIYALNCNGCTFRNLTIANFYRHTSATDTAVDATQSNAIRFSGSDITIANNTIHDVGWALYAQWNNGNRQITIRGNNIYNVDHGFASTSGFAGGNLGPIYVYDNNIHDFANWDTTAGVYHHDGIHCYTVVSQPGASHYTGFYIYNNRFGGAAGQNTTSDIFLEGRYGQSGATPCSDASSSVYIFNNVFTSTDEPTDNAYISDSAGNGGIYNNTVVGSNNTITRGGCAGYGAQPPGARVAFENNVLTTCNNLIGGSPDAYAPGSLDHNVYANGGNNSFVCGSSFYLFSQFASWQSCMRADAHSTAVASAGLAGNGSPDRGSPATHVGKNLTDLCRGALVPLCSNIDGTPRRASGPWAAGAY
jgi:hypothetical protein